MTDQPQEEMDPTQREREREPDILEHEQEHKGYGEDEGERDVALPEAGSAGGKAADARPQTASPIGDAGEDQE